MKNFFISSWLITASFSAAAAGTSNQGVEVSADQSRGKVLAITERGPHAMDAAHLLAIQTILHPAYKPEFLALDSTELSEAEAKYHLTAADLPAFIFVNNAGIEIGRIAAGPLTTVGRYVANNSAIVDN